LAGLLPAGSECAPTGGCGAAQERPEMAAMLEVFPPVPPRKGALPILNWETHMARPSPPPRSSVPCKRVWRSLRAELDECK